MQITLEIDDQTVAQIDEIAEGFQKSRTQYISENLRMSLRRDLARTGKLTDEEIQRMYTEAYRKNPVQPDEFEVEDEQMEDFWKQV